MPAKPRLTYANVVATIALFGVFAGGGAYAASKIATKDIARHAVTSAKLANGSVNAGKLAKGSVKAKAIAPNVDGVALAGVRVLDGGSYLSWFNRLGSAPAIEHPSVGRYEIIWPGWSPTTATSIVRNATLAQGPSGEVQAFLESSAGSPAREIVLTRDSSGALADRSFNYVALGTSQSLTP